MSLLCEIVQILSAASLGLFAGAMLTEAFVLVPYWRSLRPAAFFEWYAANDRRLMGFFSPLTSATALLALAAAGISLWTAHPGRWLAALAAALSAGVVATYFLHFQKANASFAAAGVGPEDLPAALARWASWHRLRTGASLAAFAAALAAFWRSA